MTIHPHTLLVGSFLLLIVLGTALLEQSFATPAGSLALIDALFTATSAVCVTGLIVVDTSSAFTQSGQAVIMLLFQLGGLGIMTFSALLIFLSGGSLSMRTQHALQETFYQRPAAHKLRRDLLWIVGLTFGIEAFGALVLWTFTPEMQLFDALFHAVSAFCNAGFSTFSSSVMQIDKRHFSLIVIMVLIIVGGLGYPVLFELLDRHGLRGVRERKPKLSLHTRACLRVTVFLIIFGTAALFVGEALMGHHLPFIDALFQSVTTRTAGFNSVDIGALQTPTLLIIIAWMFIGGSPASCAGGIKTTTIFVWFAAIRSFIREEAEVAILGRRLSTQLVNRAFSVVSIGLLFNMFGIFVLSVTERGDPQISLTSLMFEQFSAFATVGLSTGITPLLSAPGKLWIILSMFVGRVGPLAIAAVFVREYVSRVRYPEEYVMIG
ncbi:MAG: hypothetical protein KDD44_04650 [Bdellovibrionales bacterium]|nr:hypothetical protein [Bdellovibrionales bacterium]